MSSSIENAHLSTARETGLQRLLGACEAHTFLRDYLGERMLHVSGPPDRWTDLFSWRDLNDILNQGFVHHPRVRLIQQGADVDVNLYTYTRGLYQYADSQRCQALMMGGATFILQNIESVSARLDRFVREIERDLHADVRVDVVATCASVPGLNMHWDNAECFNLQLDGEKHWKVVRPERLYPLTATSRFPQRNDTTKPTPPDVPPNWEGTLAPGDMIYLPRGWWHAVTPHVSPSLHLSIAVEIPTLSDFLQWFAGMSTQHESARRPLPVWRTADERRLGVNEALRSLASELTAETVEVYLRQFEASAALRPDFTLPETAASVESRLDGRTRVRLRSPKSLSWTLKDSEVTFEWRGHPYRFHAQVVPVLRKLESARAFTLDELSEGGNRLIVRAFVMVLLTAGVVSATER